VPLIPNSNQQQARRLADYYRLRYSQPVTSSSGQKTPATASAPRSSVLVQAVEVHGLPDNLDDLDFNSMSIGEDLVSNPAIFDTGASHGFTGSKSFLHNFCSLPKPIPVSVATNRANSFISGVADLKFTLPNGNVVILHQVLYCEHAKATLISMAALHKADALVAYDNTVDSFVISNRNGSPIFTCTFEPKQNWWILPHPFIPVDDLAKNGQPLFQIFHASPEFPTLFSSGVSPPPSDLPYAPMPVESLDLVDDVSHANKKSRVLKPATTDVSLSPDELAKYFKQPVTDAPGYKWQPDIMSKDKVKLLHYHRLFKHAGLRHIRKLIKDKLGSGLLDQLPAGKIHCPVCAISKSTEINPLASTNREIERMDIMAVNLIGPFQVNSVDGRNVS
jgi:hypothetical protein